LIVQSVFHAGGLGLYAMPTFHTRGAVNVQGIFEPAEMLDLIKELQVMFFSGAGNVPDVVPIGEVPQLRPF